MDSLKKRRRGHDELSASHSGSASYAELKRQPQVALTAEQTELSTQLSAAIKDLSQRAIFAVGGSVNVADHGIHIYYRNKPTSSPSLSVFSLSSTSTTDQATALSSLCSACEPAPFGLNQETIHDPTVRTALQLTVDQFAVNFHPAATSILHDVARILVREEKNIRCELYKLNVYESGGFFRTHVDTPRSTSHFGSLVVCLPVAFTGGLLTVEHNNNQSVWDWSSNRTASSSSATSSSSSSALSLQWCAFFSDCAHWIDRVESGHRITLTYNLFMESADEHKNESLTNRQSTLPHLPDESTAFQTFALLVRGVCSRLPKGAVLGYYTQHGYAHTASAAHKDKRLRPAVLKGADALVWAAFTHANIRCQFQAVVNQQPPDDGEGEEADTNSKPTYVQQTFKEISDADQLEEDHEVEEAIVSQLSARLFRVIWLNEANRQYDERAMNYIAYGNEASLDCINSASAILIYL